MTVKTMAWPGRLRIVMVGGRGWIATFTVSRSWYVHTGLHRQGRPARTKNWTRKRARRHFLERASRR